MVLPDRMTRTGRHEEEIPMTTTPATTARTASTLAASTFSPSTAGAPAPTTSLRPRRSRRLAALAAGVGALVVTAAACGGAPSGPGPFGGPGSTVTPASSATTTPASSGGSTVPSRQATRDRAGNVRQLDGDESGQSLHRTLETSGRVNPNYTMADFMTEVVDDVAQMWTTKLTSEGQSAPQVRYHWLAPGESVTTGCGDTTNDKTAEYCPKDDTIYLSQQLAVTLWEGGFQGSGGTQQQRVGDFAVAVAIAHEFGHNVQNELDLPGTVLQHEDHADCLAGVWANAAYYQGILDPGDPEEAVDAMTAAGSKPGRDHGTSQERAQAFLLGYNTGNAGTCRTTYLGA